MPRMQIIEPKTDSGPGADMLNGPLKAKQINIFKGLAVNANVLGGFLAMAGKANGGALTPQEYETVILATSQQNGCDYCVAAHTKISAGLGIEEAESLDIRRGSVSDAKRQSLIDFTTAVNTTNGNVSDEQLGAFRAAGYGDDAVIEVIGAITVATFTNLYNHVNRTEVDFPVPPAI